MTNEMLKNLSEREVKHPWLAVLLSKMFPGAGQIYGGARARGIFFITATIVLFLILVLSFCGFLLMEDAKIARIMSLTALGFFFVMVLLGIYGLFDAYRIVKRYNAENAQPAVVSGARKPWLAAFLSSFFPGIGQLYNRQVLKGIAFIAGIIIVTLLEEVFIPFFVLGLFVYLFAIKDAFDSAEALNGSGESFFRQKRAVVLFIVVMISLGTLPFPAIIKGHALEAFKMPSGSMYPTLIIGDHFLIRKTKAFRTSLKRGDVVVFPYPVNPKKNFVKRVIGLGGDKIQIINGELYINDQLMPTTLVGARAIDNLPPSKEYGPPIEYEERIGEASYRVQYLRNKSELNEGPWFVPQDAVFVMGDNRDNSQDSRNWGPVPQNSIMGIAMKIYWSWDYENASVRWERIGETLHAPTR